MWLFVNISRYRPANIEPKSRVWPECNVHALNKDSCIYVMIVLTFNTMLIIVLIQIEYKADIQENIIISIRLCNFVNK